MTLHFADDHVALHHGDCLDVLAALDDDSIHSVVTDPPYSLSFMGRTWDTHDTPLGFQTWCAQWAAECLRVLKPGGHMVAFGGTRTWHRLAAAAEDAGFTIRDSIAWMYGSGFPKSLDVAKAIDRAQGVEADVVGERSFTRKAGQSWTDEVNTGMFREGSRDVPVTAPTSEEAKRWQGWGTALKPSFEPIVVARKPFAGTVAANVLEHGTGALNIDGCRMHMSDVDREKFERGREAWMRMSEDRGQTRADGSHRKATSIYGEYGIETNPAHPGGRWPSNVALDEAQAAELDAQSGDGTSRRSLMGAGPESEGWGMHTREPGVRGHDDSGGASRFFYTAKAATAERVRIDGTAHPTVKPLSLMQWLVRLVTPPGGTVLEPFAGSGTTVEACIAERFRCVAIEREADYLPLILQRIHRRIDPVEAVRASGEDLGLFGLLDNDDEEDDDACGNGTG